MKSMLFFTVLFSMSSVFAKVDGLVCKMEYSTNDMLSTASPKVTTMWMTDGSELASEAVIADGDGMWGTSPANYIQVSTVTIDGTPMWQVKVLGGEMNLIGTFTFIENNNNQEEMHGMKATFPVNAFDEGEEDPTRFNVLEVTCFNTIFAG